eukprot:c27645_g1_i1 orf=1-273(-)
MAIPDLLQSPSIHHASKGTQNLHDSMQECPCFCATVSPCKYPISNSLVKLNSHAVCYSICPGVWIGGILHVGKQWPHKTLPSRRDCTVCTP